MGAAMYTADLRAGAMHGKQYFRTPSMPGWMNSFCMAASILPVAFPGCFDLVVNVESQIGNSSEAHRKLRWMQAWRTKHYKVGASPNPQNGAQIVDAAHSEKSPCKWR